MLLQVVRKVTKTLQDTCSILKIRHDKFMWDNGAVLYDYNFKCEQCQSQDCNGLMMMTSTIWNSRREDKKQYL